MMFMLRLIVVLKQQFIEFINGKSQRSKHKKSNVFCFDDMIDIKNFHSNLLEIDKELLKDIDIYYIGHITIKTFSDCENIQ